MHRNFHGIISSRYKKVAGTLRVPSGVSRAFSETMLIANICLNKKPPSATAHGVCLLP